MCVGFAAAHSFLSKEDDSSLLVSVGGSRAEIVMLDLTGTGEPLLLPQRFRGHINSDTVKVIIFFFSFVVCLLLL